MCREYTSVQDFILPFARLVFENFFDSQIFPINKKKNSSTVCGAIFRRDDLLSELISS